jgi:hypothetical protein
VRKGLRFCGAGAFAQCHLVLISSHKGVHRLYAEVVANVAVEIAAFGFGEEQFSVGLQGNLEIGIDLASAEPQLQDAVIG